MNCENSSHGKRKKKRFSIPICIGISVFRNNKLLDTKNDIRFLKDIYGKSIELLITTIVKMFNILSFEKIMQYLI